MATDAEKLVIRALCLGSYQGSVKDVVIPLLGNYRWQFPLHHAIFDALVSIPSSDPATIRRLLPAKLTRLGFPDIEWEEFFAPLSISKDEIMVAVRRMLSDSKAR